MEKLLMSGMMLVEKTYGDLHILINTPYGLRCVETSGDIIEFKKENYKKAYIPESYDDPWVSKEGTEVIFED